MQVENFCDLCAKNTSLNIIVEFFFNKNKISNLWIVLQWYLWTFFLKLKC